MEYILFRTQNSYFSSLNESNSEQIPTCLKLEMEEWPRMNIWFISAFGQSQRYDFCFYFFFFGGVDLSNHDWQINVYIIVVVSLTKSRLLFLLDVMWEMPQKRLWRFLAIKRWLMWIKVLSLTISFILFISYLNKFKFRQNENSTLQL